MWLQCMILKCGGLILNFWHSSAEVGNDVEKGAKLWICFCNTFLSINSEIWILAPLTTSFPTSATVQNSNAGGKQLVRHTLNLDRINRHNLKEAGFSLDTITTFFVSDSSAKDEKILCQFLSVHCAVPKKIRFSRSKNFLLGCSNHRTSKIQSHTKNPK